MKTVISPVDIKERKTLDLRAGDTVRVHSKIVEKGKTRLQAYEGLVLARKHGSEAGATFTVRRVASGVGMEKVFPLYSPNISKIEILKRSKVRRSKLYYIRAKAAKEVSRKMKQLFGFGKMTVADENKPAEEIEAEIAASAETEVAPEVQTQDTAEVSVETTDESTDNTEAPATTESSEQK